MQVVLIKMKIIIKKAGFREITLDTKNFTINTTIIVYN